MTNEDISKLKSWLQAFARLYADTLNPSLEKASSRFLEREMNRLANLILATLPQVPVESILVPSLGQTWAIAIDPAWTEFTTANFADAFICTPVVSLESVCKPGPTIIQDEKEPVHGSFRP